MPLQVVLLRQAVVSSRLGTVASCLSMQMQGVGVPANKTSPYSSRHSLGYVADMVATAVTTFLTLSHLLY